MLGRGLIDRRRVMLGLAATVPCRAMSAPVEGAAGGASGTMVIAGPSGSRLDRWADLLSDRIGRGLAGRTPLERLNVGGLDGVTGANQFEARSEPDGKMVLLVPGSAAVSWLVGEARAKFDPARWVPLLAGTSSGVLVSRVALIPGVPLRIAAQSPVGPELPVLLALDMLGIDARLVGSQSPDAVLLQGSSIPAGMVAASASGMAPVLSFGTIGPDGAIRRDQLLPTVPTILEVVGTRSAPALLDAVRAATIAVQLEAGLVLPFLTPAASVALWRSACSPLQSDPEAAADAARLGAVLMPSETAAACARRLAGGSEMLVALRSWLSTRHDWRPI